ncbi:MAG: Ig-like domain-containing protein, partial [Verrucomicrobia bacterium]|nr:Ig-like domain-containing protein [Verrucomicrobiota bacterium]
VGGADGTLMGDAAYDGNGQVDLDGTSGTYVDLPAGLISQTNIASGAVTLMGWATIDPSNQKWDYLYAFGNISGLAGAPNTPGLEFLIMTPYNGGGNGQFAAGYVGENWTTFSPNLLGQTNVQVTLVFNSNPTRDFLGCYVNGVLANWTHTTVPFSSIADDYSYLGHSLYGNDPYMIGSIREFRIYNGELAPFQIAAAYQAGPDNTNFLTGTPTGLALNPGSQPIAAGDQRVVQALMNFTQVSNVVVNGGSTLTFISSDPSVATVDNQGLLTALKLGSATITATYGYVSTGTTNYFTNSTAVSVFNDYPATLMHRYSFTSNADDSVGGANGTLAGSANVANGQLVLPNTTSVSPAADYLQLPPGILTNDVNGIATTNAAFSTLTTLVAGSYTTNYNDPAVTIEAWATLAPNQYTWAALYNFGVQDSSGHAAYDLICQANNAGTRTMAKISDSDDDNQHNDAALAPPVLQAQTNIYIATVFDPSAGYVAIYTNGVLMAENYQATITMAGVLGDRNIIGADDWPDPGMQGSIDEFRIWNGVLHPSEIAKDYQLGPNVLPTPTGP